MKRILSNVFSVGKKKMVKVSSRGVNKTTMNGGLIKAGVHENRINLVTSIKRPFRFNATVFTFIAVVR